MMTNQLAIALAQINPSVGDIEANTALITKMFRKGNALGADLIVTGELSVSGYPPEDLVLKSYFLDQVEIAVNKLAEETKKLSSGLLIGAPWRVNSKLYNAAILLDNGRIADVRRKHKLPNYGVFDEARIFSPSDVPGPIHFRDVLLGVMICEDMWSLEVSECLAETGAELFIVLNGSPFEVNKADFRLNHAIARITETNKPIVYVNLVGGQDELVFDGGSFVIGSDYKLRACLPSFSEELLITHWEQEPSGWVCQNGPKAPTLSEPAKIYSALALGLKDYVKKNAFPGVVIGLSGGVDSALTAAIAVDALGSKNVRAVMMPSPFTSPDSILDAAETANSLNIHLDQINIHPAMKTFESLLTPLFVGQSTDVTEENIQARTRALLLMAISNKFGYMLLTTGNKSEMSVGFSTLYGDMCGGFSVLKDVYKTTVFELCHWRNTNQIVNGLGPTGQLIPKNIITKPPSAELAANQKDEDSLPPYSKLDHILRSLIEEEKSLHEIINNGFNEQMVRKVWKMLDRAEYKRRQAPPGVKISVCAFGRDRRYPITNGFTGQL